MSQLVIFKSQPKQTFFAPEYEYYIFESKIESVDFGEIKKFILMQEKIILKLPLDTSKLNIDGFTGLGENSTTSRFGQYNVFSWDLPEIQKLKSLVHSEYVNFLQKINVPRRKVYIQAWVNIMRAGDEIKPHLHSVDSFSYLSGHITVACENTSTVYICPVNQINEPFEYKEENQVGNLTLFQSTIPHYTTKHTANNERVTIAFDLKVSEAYNPDKHKNFIIFDDPK